MILNKENLYQEYIINKKSRKKCAELFKCKESTIKYKISQWGVNKKNKPQITKNNLYQYYIVENHSIDECAKHFNCSIDTIKRRKKKYSIKKSKEKGIEKRKETNQERYGGNAPSSSIQVQKRIKKTNLERNNIKNISKKELYKQFIIIDNTVEECANYFQCGETTIKKRLKEFKIQKKIANHTKKNIKNIKIYEDDELLIKWIKNKSNKLGRKILYIEIANEFNIAVSTVSKRIIKMKKKFDKNKYINLHPKSVFENVIKNWLSDNNIKYEYNVRSIIKNPKTGHGWELDFVIEDKKIAIEMNDTETHCIEYKIRNGYSLKAAKNYHNLKTELADKSGYRLIHIFEKDLDDLDNVLSVLLPAEKVNARDLIYKHDYPVRNFIIKNHRQHTCNKKLGGALVDKSGNIIGAIVFENNGKDLNLDKLCFRKGFNVRGGSSKLFKNYLKNIDVSSYKSIITYCDTTYHSGKVYEELGFKLDKEGVPSYYWVKNKNWETREKMQKKKLQKRFKLTSKYVDNHTEREICNKQGYVSVYMCNQEKYIYNL